MNTMNVIQRKELVETGTVVGQRLLRGTVYQVIRNSNRYYLHSPLGALHQIESYPDFVLRSDVVLDDEVEVSALFRATISRKEVIVQILGPHQLGGWWALNTVTNRQVWIEAADRLSATLPCAYPKVTARLVEL